MSSNNDSAHSRSLSEGRPSNPSIHKRSISDDHLSPIIVDDEDDHDHEAFIREEKASRIPKPHPIVKKIPSTNGTRRALIPIPAISRRPVQGVLVRFFRNGDGHDPGVQIAINELELKSWEAFLNYLNRQKKLTLRSGGIKHVYSLYGNEIRSMTKFQHRQCYVVASGGFIKTTYQHMNDIFNEENEPTKASMNLNEQLFLIPYSRLNVYETMIFNRNVAMTFEQWLEDQVTDLLLRFNGPQPIKHLYAVTKFTFNQVTSFSQLFNMLKVTDTFIACTDDEFEHSKASLATMRPSDFFINTIWPRKSVNNLQKYVAKPVDEAKLSMSWIYGYEGSGDQTKRIFTISTEEILYVIGSIVVLFNPIEKRQRFYTKHNNSITCLNVHSSQPLVVSSEKINAKVLIQIWNHQKLEPVVEVRREQLGSDVLLLNFSPRIDENYLLVVSKDKPKTLHIIDWKRNELIHSINVKSDRILSSSFIFNRIDWICCITGQHVLFYQINFNSKPIRLVSQREAEVQNIYTGAITSDYLGERLIIGDKVGSVHIWRLVNNEPKLSMIKEHILENDVHFLQSINAEEILLANGQNQIRIWNFHSNRIDSEFQCKETLGTIQSIVPFRDGFIIGTRSNLIVYQTENNVDIVMRGHINPIVCLCHQKSNSNFFSISSDRYLFKWNLQTKSVEWTIKCPQLISSADLHPERNIIALGTETSKLLIYDTITSFYVSTIVLKVNTGVKAVRFSPNGAYLAVGLQNGQISLFDVFGNGDFRLRAEEISQNLNRSVIDVIWSLDSNSLLVVFNDNNYQIWSISTWTLLKGQNIQLISWQELTHPITCALFDQSIVESHSSAIVLSPSLVLCCGKDGQIRLFRNHYERHFQTFQIGLGPVQNLVPSSNKKLFYLSIVEHPTLIEFELNIDKV